MPLLEESQQHALQDVKDLLVELQQQLSAHGKFLAKFGQHSLTEEAPISLDMRSPQLSTWHTRPPDVNHQLRALPSGNSNSSVQPPQPKVASSTRTWRPPPSRTTGEFVPTRVRIEAPLFNGDDPLGWIFGIQDYFNYFLTEESVRLAVVEKIIEQPALDWFRYYQKNNGNGSWEDFLVAVRYHFASELTEEVDDEEQLDGSSLCAGIPDEVLDVDVVSQNVVLELVADKIPSDVDAPDGGVALSAAAQLVPDPIFVVVPCDVVACSCNVRLSPVLREDTIYEVRKLCEFSNHEVDGDDALLVVESAQKDPQYVAAPTPSDSDYMESCLEQQAFPSVGDHNLFRFEQKLYSDGRLIPPCNAATSLDGCFTTSWRPMGSRTAGEVSAIAALPHNLFIALRSLEDVPIETVVWVCDNRNTLGTSHMSKELSSKATYANVVSVGLIYEGALILDSSTMLEVEKGMLDFEELSEQIDTLSIPPSFPLTLEVEKILLGLMDSKPMEVSYHGDGEWSCATLRFGEDDGARIFDPGVFKGVETIQVTYSVVESGVDASHCGVTVLDATEMVDMFRILLYSMVANQSIVKEFGWKEILIGYNDSDDGRELVSYFGAMKGVRIFDPGDFESHSTLDETLMFLFHYPP